MTHAESQDLLLDLAYGELPPERAQEVLGHVAGCAECQREKAALDEARRLTAPLRELEEPSEGFDDRILAAARAQAQLDNDGSLGQVVEVSGSVRPLGLEPARIDSHGPVAARSERRRPRWALRVALGGSVAAAAALALVVSTSLQTRQAQERAAQLASDKTAFEIHVQPAPVAVAEKEALQKAQEQRGPEAAPVSGKQELPKLAAEAPPPAKAALKKDVAQNHALLALQGSGGDAVGGGALAGAVGGKPADQPAASLDATARMAQKPAAAEKKGAPPPPPAEVALEAPAAPPPVRREAPAAAAAPPPLAAVAMKGEPAPLAGTVAVKSEAAPPAGAVAMKDEAEPTALAVEAEAQRHRHAGRYGLAATMYQQAAKLPRAPGDQAESPAWDLAHAVECLAAAGMFDEARQVREQLTQLYPSEKTAYSAAGRALREVELAPASRGPSSKPPAKAKTEPTRSDDTVPADF
ncbi:MAG: anti-sigma factor family protein [Myxococcales bacterium]